MTGNEHPEPGGERLVEVDTDGDGRPDMWSIDQDGDGKADRFEVDLDGDGTADISTPAKPDPASSGN